MIVGWILNIVLIFIFYYVGFWIAEVVDFQFEEHEEWKEDQSVVIELMIELSIGMLIKWIFERYHRNLLDPIYDGMGIRTPDFIYTVILISFAVGVHQNMKKTNKKMNHLIEKYKGVIINKLKKKREMS